jgi:hypothetical protein
MLCGCGMQSLGGPPGTTIFRLRIQVLWAYANRRMVASFVVGLSLLATALAHGQELDDNDTPLGDVARSLRKKAAASEEVIDNDNLSKVMDDVDRRRLSRSSLQYSIDGLGKTFQVSAPDVTCSLSFTANVKSLLSSAYVQMDLPADQLLKLSGPAAIHGDSLEVSVFNGTDWHVSEVAVALTVVKRGEFPEAVLHDRQGNVGQMTDGLAKLVPAAGIEPLRETDSHADNRSEKRSDIAVLYRMRAAAAPFVVTVFAAPLNVEIGPDQEWHWAIVQAKGYPPQPHTSDQTARAGIAPQLQSDGVLPISPTGEGRPTSVAPLPANPSQEPSNQLPQESPSR